MNRKERKKENLNCGAARLNFLPAAKRRVSRGYRVLGYAKRTHAHVNSPGGSVGKEKNDISLAHGSEKCASEKGNLLLPAVFLFRFLTRIFSFLLKKLKVSSNTQSHTHTRWNASCLFHTPTRCKSDKRPSLGCLG